MPKIPPPSKPVPANSLPKKALPQKTPLCALCLARFPSSKSLSQSNQPQSCFICQGSLSQLEKLASAAIEQSQEFEWSTFSISTSFPKATLVREDLAADSFQPGLYPSMKNHVNSILSTIISEKTGKKNDQRFGEAQLSIHFGNLIAAASPAALYVFGHYIKKSRLHCQSRWHCSECNGRGCASCKGSGQNYPSIEEELGKELCTAFCAKAATLHASGREDVNVLMLGNGRPFVMELSKPKKRACDLAKLEGALYYNPNVSAIRLEIVCKPFLDAVCNSHFNKEYVATVSADRPLSKEDALACQSLSGKTLLQQTPTRVLARRADLVRKRKIFSLTAEENRGKLTIRILAEAGTYIKELISSDSGRTKPSLASLLGCKALCEELDVVAIHDGFLDTVAR